MNGEKEVNILFPVLICFIIFSYAVSGAAGLVRYFFLFIIGLLIGFILREIRNLRGGRKR